MSKKKIVGSVDWVDLTIEDAEGVQDFYKKVVGYTSIGLDMGGYEDYCMNSPQDDKTKVGICHSKGVNSEIPPVWLVYINVADLEKSIAACKKNGGEILMGAKAMGKDKMCIIRDPAGAVCALYEHFVELPKA